MPRPPGSPVQHRALWQLHAFGWTAADSNVLRALHRRGLVTRVHDPGLTKSGRRWAKTFAAELRDEGRCVA